MSIDKSLRSKDQLKRQRNVLKRAERITELQKKKEWQEGDSVFGLPKVKILVRRKKVKAKEEVKEEAAVEGATAIPAEEGKEKGAPEKKTREKDKRERELFKVLKKEVETGANGTQNYIIKKGINKNTIAKK